MLRVSFNDGWHFKLEDGGMFAEAGGETAVTLPHDAMALGPRKKENHTGNSGGFYAGGNYLYTKDFYISEEMRGKRIFLEFEGVYNQARVYVNGDYICGNLYGYSTFYADITGSLNYGCDNQIQIKVQNSDVPSARWYTGGGIYRPVWLLEADEISIGLNGLKITTIEAADDISTIEAAIQFQYDGRESRNVRVLTEIKDLKTEEVICREETKVTLYADDPPLIRQRIYIRQAGLWSVDSPNLYVCHVKVVEQAGNRVIIADEAIETFGIRHIQADPMHGLRINGKRIVLRGACIHHDNGIVGAAAFEQADERRVRHLKEAGFNALRMAHNPASGSLLRACDKLGMLVMDESFDMWTQSKLPNDYSRYFETDWENAIEAMVEKDYNHPCVIIYSIGNEIQEVGTPAGAKINRRIAEKIRELDSSRFVTNGMNGLLTVMDKIGDILKDLKLVPEHQDTIAGASEGDINDLMTAAMDSTGAMIQHPLIGERLEESCGSLDISGYNYMTGRYAIDTKAHPNRLFVGTETYSPQIAENWKHMQENPAVIGDFTWTGYDYIGESGIGVADYNEGGGFFAEYPCYLANVGDIDLIGCRRPMSYYREIVWGLRKTPYLAVQPPEYYDEDCVLTPWIMEPSESTWTWTGYEGKPCKVEVYSGDEEVELFINEVSCGKLPTGEKRGFRAVFDAVYRPGTITAVAYSKGKESGRYTLTTLHGQTRLELQAENAELKAGKQNVAFIMISLRDDNGIIDYQSRKKVRVEVTGAGTLLGLGSADPFSTENFYDTERTPYRGRVLAAIRAGDKPGSILVRVLAEGCEPAEQQLSVN